MLREFSFVYLYHRILTLLLRIDWVIANADAAGLADVEAAEGSKSNSDDEVGIFDF